MNILDNAVGILENVAPTIATMIGGPLAGQGIAALEKLFGLNPTGDKEAVLKAVAGATPEQLIEMKKLDNDLKGRFLDAGITLEKLDQEDRASARSMQVATRSVVPAILSGAICLMAAVTAGIVLAGKTNTTDTLAAGLTGTVIGYIFSELKQVTTYWFGSSRGSESKNEMLSRALEVTKGS